MGAEHGEPKKLYPALVGLSFRYLSLGETDRAFKSRYLIQKALY
jgi:hypothetical protein